MPEIFKEAAKKAAGSLFGLCGLALGLLIWRILLLGGVDPDTSLSVAVAIASAAILSVAIPVLLVIAINALSPRFMRRLTGKVECYLAWLDGTFRTRGEYEDARQCVIDESRRDLSANDVTFALSSDERDPRPLA